MLATANSIDEVSAFYKGATRVLANAGLPLRSWATNANDVTAMMRHDGVDDDRTEVPVLGMSWNTVTDTLALKHHPVSLNLPTKRLVLRALASQYDPLGLLSPITIVGKLLMQDIWREHHGWDELLPAHITERWEIIAPEFNKMNSIEIPRSELRSGNISLHAFADASKSAYGAAIYAVQHDKATLLIAKGKVAPLSTLTIPKLELTAATIATRLVKYVMDAYAQEFIIDSVHLYSDSQITLGWIKSNQTLPVYVQNRVNEIASTLPDATWHYVASSENPADIVSRGTDVATLKSKKLWWRGPTWLNNDLPPAIPEQRSCKLTSLPVTVSDKGDSIRIAIIEKCSSWRKAVRLHAHLIKCVKVWKWDQTLHLSGSALKDTLKASDIRASVPHNAGNIQKCILTC